MFQALEVIRQIKDAGVMPIDRAQMRIKLTLPQKVAKQVLEKLRPSFKSVESEEWQGDLEIVSITVVYVSHLSKVVQLSNICHFLGLFNRSWLFPSY